MPADEIYGSDSHFRNFLEERNQPYVVAVSCQQRLWVVLRQRRLDAIAKEIPQEHWFRMSVGDGAKGPREYDSAAGQFGMPTDTGLCRWVSFRRSLDGRQEHAYYLCLAPADATAQELAKAAGQ